MSILQNETKSIGINKDKENTPPQEVMFARMRLFLPDSSWCNGVGRGGRRGVFFFSPFLMPMEVASCALANGGQRTEEKPR